MVERSRAFKKAIGIWSFTHYRFIIMIKMMLLFIEMKHIDDLLLVFNDS